MIAWIFWTIYLLGYVACWRIATWRIVTDTNDLPISIVLGAMFACAWPAIVTGIAAMRVYEACNGEAALMSLITPRAQKRRVALDERERRIAELEREVGIR